VAGSTPDFAASVSRVHSISALAARHCDPVIMLVPPYSVMRIAERRIRVNVF
jgi:hypothetical protein